MSFSFGTPQTTAGLTFGTAAQASDKPTGFSFGSPGGAAAPNAAPAFGASPSPSGFSFGAPNTTAPTASPFGSGLSFGAPAGAAPAPATSGFSFTSPPANPNQSPFAVTSPAQPAVPSNVASPGSFVQPVSLSSFSFANKPTTTASTINWGGGSGGLTFGQSATSPPSASSSFGVPVATLAPAPAFSFSSAPPAFGQTSVPAVALPAAPLSAATPNLSFSQTPVISNPISFGQTSAPTNTAAPLSFGLPSVSTAAPSLSFGSTPTSVGLSFGQPVVSTAAPSKGFSLGAVQQSAPAANTGLSLPTPVQPPVSAQPASAPTSTTAGFGSKPFAGGFLAPSTATPSASSTALPPATSAITTAPSTTAFSGFQLPISSQPPAQKPPIAGIASLASTVASSLPSVPAPTATTLTVPPTTSAPPLSTVITSSLPTITGFQLPSSTSTTAAATLTTSATTSTASAPSAIQSMNFAQLEESINKWSLELEDSEKVFINQATQINAWDKLLIANGDKIVELNEMLQNARAEQQSLDHEMDFIIGQQRELEELLIPLEKELGNVTITDPDREQTYQLADSVDTQLKQMSEDLKEIIEHLNESHRSDDTNDPIVQIGKILNAHMSSMQWIDSSTAQISSKLEQLSAMHNIVRRDNERSFYLTYN